ncbi:breast carcinoma-amplified sequence 3 [Anaeramoeba flamelloides]|uniref:Breast carcinoma-amplified sequence 3 n=1 Tax=Anaeramoeba flamelloides TaxID=1746091 RepID=A0ABQ8Z3Z3_9EUKA|nr:breast carcinoma-amplified sequence 3 [Anaeramoeba flamelloides]
MSKQSTISTFSRQAKQLKIQENEIYKLIMNKIPQVADSFQFAGRFLPSKIKKTIDRNKKPKDADQILKIDYQTYQKSKFMIICYFNGVQVWNLNDGENIKEVVSIKTVAIRSAKFICETKLNELQQNQPFLGLLSLHESEDFPRSCLKLFSLKTNKFYQVLRFKSSVYNFDSTNDLIIASTQHEINIIEMKTMKLVHKIQYFPNPINSGIFALGKRFCAFPALSPESKSPDPNYLQYFYESSKKILENLLETIILRKNNKSIMKKTTKKFGEILKLSMGLITIYDLKNRKEISTFKAHKHIISYLQFDQSGQLLMTSSLSTQIRIYRMGNKKPKLIYILRRGYTNALIQNVSFSPNLKLVSISTNHGTTHIFPINIDGEKPSTHTHVKEFQSLTETECNISEKTIINSKIKKNDLKKKLEEIHSLAKIKQTVIKWRKDKKKNINSKKKIKEDELSPLPLSLSSLFFNNTTLFISSFDGLLTKFDTVPYKMNFESQKGKNNNQDYLALRPIRKQIYSIQRHNNWPTLNLKINQILLSKKLKNFKKSKKKINMILESNEKQSQQMKLMEDFILNNFEPKTTKILPPLWISRQFSVGIYTNIRNRNNMDNENFHKLTYIKKNYKKNKLIVSNKMFDYHPNQYPNKSVEKKK